MCGEVDSIEHIVECTGVGGIPSDLQVQIRFLRKLFLGSIGRSPAPILPPVACEIDLALEASSKYVPEFSGPVPLTFLQMSLLRLLNEIGRC